jgi:hypothetical protein
MAGDSGVQFIDGLRVFAPSAKVPSWVKFKFTIDCAALQKFMQAESDEKGILRGEVRESKGGKFYAAMDNFKAKARGENNERAAASEPDDDRGADGLPF